MQKQRQVVQKFDLNLKLYGEKSKLILGSSMISSRITWLVIVSKNTQCIPALKRRNGSGVAQSEFEKADELNAQFTEVFTKTEHNQVPLLGRSAPIHGRNCCY